jgi:hypothetical protein
MTKNTSALIKQVNHDVQKELSRFNNQKIGMRMLSTSMGLHTKTLDRLMINQHKPSYQTLIKIYSYIYKQPQIPLLIEMVPGSVKAEILRLSPNRPEILISNDLATDYLKKNDIALLIYAHCGSGAISRKAVTKRFGDYGIKCLEELIRLDLIEEGPKDHYKIGKCQIHLDPQLLKKLSVLFIETQFRPENSELRTENYLGFLTESISEEAYQKILLLERAHFEEKIKIIDNPKNRGEVMFFSATFTDRTFQ